MIADEEIFQNIDDMGYVTCKPVSVKPSYYKLNDGTSSIVSALIRVNHLTRDSHSPDDFMVRSSNQINIFVPQENRMPSKFRQFQQHELQSGIIDDDVEYDVLSESFSVYELSNGFVLSVKTVVDQIRKTKFFTPLREPVYTVGTNPIVKIKKST